MKTLTLFALVAILSACGAGEGTASVALYRIAAVSARTTIASVPSTRAGVTVNSGVTLESLQLPIRAIYLSTGTSGTGELLYDCAADTNADCMVDLTGSATTTNLLPDATNMKVKAGDYSYVSIAFCKDEGLFTGLVKAMGKVDPGGTGSTVYTQSADGTLTTTSGSYDSTTVYFNSCRRVMKLAEPLKVEGGKGYPLRLYIDTRDLALMGDVSDVGGANAWTHGGWSATGVPAATYVGVAYPDFGVTQDTATPTVERFRITTSTGQVGALGIMSTAAGDYFGGYLRPYFSSSSTTGASVFTSPLQQLTDNLDGTFVLENFGVAYGENGTFESALFVKNSSLIARAFSSNGAATGTYTITKL